MTKVVTFLAVFLVGGAVLGAAIFAGIASASYASMSHQPFDQRSSPLAARTTTNSTDDAPLDSPQLTLFPYHNNLARPQIDRDNNFLRLAFNFSLTKTCSNNSVTTASGIYTNGNLIYTMSLPAGHRVAIDHGEPHYPALIAGPYLYDHGEMEFSYNGWENCAWDEGGQEYGECVVGDWEPPVEWQCPKDMSSHIALNRDQTRLKNLICSFTLGPAPVQGSTTTPPPNTPTPDIHLLPGHSNAGDLNTKHYTDGNFDTTTSTFSITEECPGVGVGVPSSQPQAKALLTSDTRIVHSSLVSNAAVPFPLSSELPPLYVGPYNFDTSDAPFSYNGTGTPRTWEANDASETGYKCGWCNATEWSSGALDCEKDGVASRTRDMNCEVAVHKGS